MTPICGLLAFFIPGPFEWTMILGLGLLLFGRRLPEVGRAVGKTIVELRRGLQNFKDEIDSDGSLKDARSAVSELRRTITSPGLLEDHRKALDPRSIFEDLTDATRASAGPLSTVAESPGEPLDGSEDNLADNPESTANLADSSTHSASEGSSESASADATEKDASTDPEQ